jgi:hypothetical protein
VIPRGAIGMLAAAILVPSSAPIAAHLLFRFADRRITEASGIAPGIASPGIFYVQNDSGNPNQIFAVSGHDGHTAATITVPGAHNVDWEDLAVAPAADGTASIWVADIGDNDAVRRTVALYRLAEPHLDPTARNQTVRLPVAQQWRLRYPSGPIDAEALAVAPDGTAYVITKSLDAATVYQVPGSPRPGPAQALRRLFVQDLPLVTGAAMSADGALFVLRSYTAAWVWRLGPRGLTGLHATPVVVPLPLQPQGEGIAIVGNQLVVDSEGTHAPVYAVPLPPTMAHPQGDVSPPAGPGRRPRDQNSSAPASNHRWWWWGGGIAVAVVGAAVLSTAARRRR